MQRFVKALTVLLLVLTLGLHWALLQTLAWTGMIISYSRVASLSTAVRMTFDGQHPCRLCCQIKEGKKDEKKSEFPATAKKLEFVSTRPVFVFVAPTDFHLTPDFLPKRSDVIHPPLTPPPRPWQAV